MLNCISQNVLSESKYDHGFIQVRFETVLFCSTCHVLGMIPYQHLSVCLRPETWIQMLGVGSGNGGRTGKEGGNREVR